MSRKKRFLVPLLAAAALLLITFLTVLYSKGVFDFSFIPRNGRTPEETMRNMGRIASPGMTQTEETIVEIQAERQRER